MAGNKSKPPKCPVCGQSGHAKCVSTGYKGQAAGTPRDKPHDGRKFPPAGGGGRP